MSTTVQEEKLRQARVEVDRRNAVNPSMLIFARADWGFVGEALEEIAFKPEPGTWCKPPPALQELVGAFGKAQAMTCCPKCKGVATLSDKATAIDALGKLTPDFHCFQFLSADGRSKCDLHRPAYLNGWLDKPLYALSFHDRANSMRIETFYTHADNVSEARMGIPNVPPQDIIGIGLAIGVFVDERADKSGNTLVAH